MSRARYVAGTSATYSGTLKNADGTTIVYSANGSAVPRVIAIALTLTNAATGGVVNSRSAQAVLNLNGVTVSGAGALVWLVAAADTTLLVSGSQVEEHLAQFAFSFIDVDGLTKYGKFEHRLVCRDGVELCTFDDVQAHLGEIPETEMLFIENLIDAFVSYAEQETGRKLLYAVGVTEHFSPLPDQRTLRLRRYPLSSAPVVRENLDGDFTQAEDDIDAADLDWQAGLDRGLVQLRWRGFAGGTGTVRVIYSGGLARDVGAVPKDLRMAAARQVAYWYQRRSDLGVTSTNIGGASVAMAAQSDILPDVRRVLSNYAPRTLI